VAIEAEGETEKVRLMRVVTEAAIGEVSKFVRFEIKDGEGLLLTRCIRAITTVEENGKLFVRREDGGGGKVVDGARMTGNFGKDAAVREVDRRLLLRGNE
jgi:hypothetical protein